MMVGAILTQNTAWTNVEKALIHFGENLTPEYVLVTPAEDLAAIIRSSGYHNQKALRLKALTEWFQLYDFQIEKVRAVNGDILRDQLLSIKGIGGETADSILTYALNKPYCVIDAYTRRILHRLGYDVPRRYEVLRIAVEERIPKDVSLYNEFHALIVEHAKRHCRKKPLCENCPLLLQCNRRMEENV